MGNWSKSSRSHVAHMNKGDFYESEKSATMCVDGVLRIEHVSSDGTVTVLADSRPVLAGEVVDASFMSVKELCAYFEREIDECKQDDLMMSLHLKATMMKVSDPIMFGHAVKVFFKDAFEKHGELFKEIGANPNNGVQAVYNSVADKLDAAKVSYPNNGQRERENTSGRTRAGEHERENARSPTL